MQLPAKSLRPGGATTAALRLAARFSAHIAMYALAATIFIGSVQGQTLWQKIKEKAREAEQQQQQQQQQQQSPQAAQASPTAGQSSAGGQPTQGMWMPPSDATAAPALKDPLELPVVAKMPDVVGVRIGMSAQEAVQVLRRQYPRDTFQELAAGCSGGVCTEGLFPLAAGQKPDYGWNVLSGDPRHLTWPDVFLSFTAPPTAQVVWRAWRRTVDMNASRTAVLTALRTKYGKESLALAINSAGPTRDDRAIAELWWFFDEQGNRAPVPAGGLNDYGVCGNPDPQPEMLAEDPEASGNFHGWCTTIVSVHVMLSGGDIIQSTDSWVMDAPLAMRTARVYVAWKRDAAQKAHQAELDKANKAKPVF